MMIGYAYEITMVEREKLKAAGCSLIVTGNSELTEVDSFQLFLDKYQNQELVLIGLESIGQTYTLIQLGTIINQIIENDISVHFVTLNLWGNTEVSHYYAIILNLVERERIASRQRATASLKQVRKDCRQGRPPLQEEIIYGIRQSYTKERMTMRQIAHKFNVSIGTVHKYSKSI